MRACLYFGWYASFSLYRDTPVRTCVLFVFWLVCQLLIIQSHTCAHLRVVHTETRRPALTLWLWFNSYLYTCLTETRGTVVDLA